LLIECTSCLCLSDVSRLNGAVDLKLLPSPVRRLELIWRYEIWKRNAGSYD